MVKVEVPKQNQPFLVMSKHLARAIMPDGHGPKLPLRNFGYADLTTYTYTS